MTKFRLIIGLAVVLLAGIGVGVFAWNQASGQQSSSVVFPTGDGTIPLVSVNGEEVSAQLVAILEANGASHAAAVNQAIDQTILRQAATRLGLEATSQEGAEYVQQIEEGLAGLEGEKRAEAEAILVAQGLPTSNLASDERMVEFGRVVRTTTKLRAFLLDRLVLSEITGSSVNEDDDPQSVAAALERLDAGEVRTAKNDLMVDGRFEAEVSRFLQEERANSTITPPEK